MADSKRLLVGNRLVLIGAVLYLLEWVAIIAAHLDAPGGAASTAARVASAYTGNTDAYAWAAGWFSVVLLGRILLMIGLREALADSGRSQRLMSLATAAMAVSVTVEIATYAIVSGAAWSKDKGGSLETIRSLDAVAFQLNNMIFGPLGVAVLCAGLAMWRSGLFNRVLPWLAIVSGVLLVLSAAALQAPSVSNVAAPLGLAVPLFWIWMIWTGVVCWRAAPRRDRDERHEVSRGLEPG
jgi:hypothetical protein